MDEGKYIYLDREAALAEIQHFAQEQGQSISISITKLSKALDEQKLLAATEKERGTLTVRRKIQGQTRHVLMLLSKTLVTGVSNPPNLPSSRS